MAVRAACLIMVQDQKIARKSAPKPNPRDLGLSRVCEYRRHTPGEAIVPRAETEGAVAGRRAKKLASSPRGVPSLGRGVDSNKTDYLEAPARGSAGGKATGGGETDPGGLLLMLVPYTSVCKSSRRTIRIRRAGQEGGIFGLCSSVSGWNGTSSHSGWGPFPKPPLRDTSRELT